MEKVIDLTDCSGQPLVLVVNVPENVPATVTSNLQHLSGASEVSVRSKVNEAAAVELEAVVVNGEVDGEHVVG